MRVLAIVLFLVLVPMIVVANTLCDKHENVVKAYHEYMVSYNRSMSNPNIPMDMKEKLQELHAGVEKQMDEHMKEVSDYC